MINKYKDELNILKGNFNDRKIPNISKEGKFVFLNKRKLLNLSSNDYLGFAENSELRKDFLKKTNYSLGSASSRLLTGTSSTYLELESLISAIYNKDATLLFNSGYHANIGILSSLAGKKDVVFSDKLNHASMIDGMKLADGDFYRYKHLDYEHLESLLEKHRSNYETAIIITESIFSMDGDCANLKKLVELKNKYDCIFIVDEAHAFGVYGKSALGICEEQDLINEIDLIIATFGKAIGSMGAFCTGQKVLIEYLTNKARSFIFSTALPEINIGFSKFIIESVLPNTYIDRQNLLLTANELRKDISSQGLKTIGSSHIIPIIIGSNENTINICKTLQSSKFYTLPIRYPTVRKNTARIRLSLRADITYNEISNIAKNIANQKIIISK